MKHRKGNKTAEESPKQRLNIYSERNVLTECQKN